MKIEEAIEKIKELSDNIQEVRFVSLECVLDIVNQIDEQPKVVIPKFVAEWIEECKSKGVYLCAAMSNDEQKTFYWLDTKEKQDIFARAWLDGYEAEKEKLYTVAIPNPNSIGGKLVLFKQQSTGRLILDMLNPNINKPKYLHLTESEIKQDFEWAWQWANELIY